MSAITPAERKRLAELYQLSEQYLYQCLTGRREMDHATARSLEERSGGVLKRQMLCQKTFKTVWPELPELPLGELRSDFSDTPAKAT